MMLLLVGDVSCPFRNNQSGQDILRQRKFLPPDKEEEEPNEEEVDLKLTLVTPTSGVLREKGPPRDEVVAGPGNNPC